MHRPAQSLLHVLTLFLLTITFAAPAHAYLDPGTGSMILQGLIAGIAMISVTLKMYWYKLTSLFRKSDPIELDDEDDVEQSGDRQTGHPGKS